MRATRRSRNPARVVAVAGLAGAVALGGLFVYASGLATRGKPLSPSAIGEVPATPVLSVRRTPTVLSVVTRTGKVARPVQAVAGLVGGGGCLAVSWKGLSLASLNVDKALVPASALKVVTASVALEVLGAAHVYETSVHGALDAGGTVPTLFLVGGGDPVLVTADYPPTEKYPTTTGTALEKLVDAVVGAGVKVVSGGVVGVDDRFDSERFVPQWSPSLRGVEAGPLGALMVNDGVVMGEPTKRDDPAVAAATEFVRLLRAKGVAVNGGVRHGILPAETDKLASIQSAPLSAIMADMLSRSDNNTAELVLKEMGLAKKGSGTTMNGTLVEIDTMKSRGNDAGLQLVDGSGLARENRIPCAALMATLSRDVGTLPSMLSVAGTSGTLRDSFTGHPVKGRLVGKTGTLSDVKSLVGYVLVDGDDPVIFAMVLNRPGVDDPAAHRALWNALADGLARAKGTPRPEQLLP